MGRHSSQASAQASPHRPHRFPALLWLCGWVLVSRENHLERKVEGGATNITALPSHRWAAAMAPISMPWTAEMALCCLWIGNTQLIHRYLVERQPVPYCEDCLVTQTVKHSPGECPSLGDCCLNSLSQCRDDES